MYLWTEYEGATIDSAFALTKLLQTEGRSAFFSTINEKGESVLIRIIECHFDEDEILARWRGVQSLGHPNFLRIDRFGQFHIEDSDITAVYAVFERVDENLGEVLKRGHLSTAEAAEIGLGVASALEALHANGFVHEHVEAGNIYAVGESVKLRSDCIRETPEGEVGIDTRRRDIHDLTAVLTQVLVGTPRDASALNPNLLPAPFDEIVRNGMRGNWGLAEIKTSLAQLASPKGVRRKQAPAGLARTNGAHSAKSASSPATLPGTIDFPGKAEISTTERVDPDRVASDEVVEREQPFERSAPGKRPVFLPGQKPLPLETVPVIFGISQHDFRKWLTIAIVILCAVLLGWILLHHGSGHHANTAQPDSVQSAVAGSRSAIAPNSSNERLGTGTAVQSRVQWRVVAFTYNHQDQAQKKVSALAQQHPDLSPTVFSPTGKAPWLVTVGGPLQRDAAYALARKARSLGLPPDTYAQDYTVR